MAFQIQKEIALALRDGCTMMIRKVSPRVGRRGGAQLVSVGPYRKAVGTKGYAVIDKDDDVQESLSAVTAAKHFVARVGRAKAHEALTRRKCPRR